jgi:tetratricopeptide (TPR) repeat protein
MNMSMRSIRRLGVYLMILPLIGVGARAGAQTSEERSRSADSLRTAIEAASARDDWAALEGTRRLADRLLADSPNDARLRYYRGYALFRLALIASRRADRHAYQDLLSEADRALEASAASLDLAETHAMRASVLGQLIGLNRNPLVALRLGPRSGAEMKRALALGPENPRVWLLRGINTMHTPKMWGGGLDPAEEYLLKAQTLFATDSAQPPNPTWGKADVEIALGQLHLMQNRRDAARADFARALTLEPENAWVRDTLMREAAGQSSARPSL